MERAEGRVDWISTGLAYQRPWNEVVLWLNARKLIHSKLKLNAIGFRQIECLVACVETQLHFQA